MAVTSVQEASDARTCTLNDDGSRRYTRVFVVQTDAASTGPGAVATAGGIPRPGVDAYAESGYADLGAICSTVRPTPKDDDRTTWLVTCEYVTPDPRAPVNINPLARPAVIEWDFQSYQKPITHDLDGEAMATAADEPFDPLPEIDVARPTLTVTKNFLNFDPTFAYRYVNAVNSDPWLGATAGQWKCQGITARAEVEGALTYWQVTATFQFEREGWQGSYLNAGYYIKDGTTRKIAQVKDNAGNTTNAIAPVLLNASGALLAIGSAPTYIERRIYESEPFGAMGLL